jgi:DNA invertase Pin-like site-specific DNA recombinase
VGKVLVDAGLGHSLDGAFSGCTAIILQEVSGAQTDRKQLRRAIDVLGTGDVLVVTRLDRLARSTRDLLNVLATVAERGAGFRSIADAWADTTTPHGRVMLTVLGGLAIARQSKVRFARQSKWHSKKWQLNLKLASCFQLSRSALRP